MLDTLFSGVGFTAPTYYMGHGINNGFEEAATSTMQKMTTGAPNYPVTNPFEDANERLPMDWSAGATNTAGGLVEKTAPSIGTLNMILAVSTGYDDVLYMCDVVGAGPAPLPAVLMTVFNAQQPPDPPLAMGDTLQIALTLQMICS